MPSQSSSDSSGEGACHTAEEDRRSSNQGPNTASSTIATEPNGSPESDYPTANQTPSATPDINRFASLSKRIAAENQASFEALADMEDRQQITAARILVPMLETESTSDSPTGKAIDESSPPYPPPPAPRVNDSRPASSKDTPQSDDIERREASDTSYTYRPPPIDPDPQQQFFLSTPPPSNNTPSMISDRTTDTYQELAPIAGDEMPHEYTPGRFVMNPRAPVFVPHQGSRPGMLPPSGKAVWAACPTDLVAFEARNPRDLPFSGYSLPKPGQVTAPQTNNPSTAAPAPKVPLLGSGHGLFFDPATNTFTGDGAPRRSPYRADGTLPSQPDTQSDFITRQQYPEPAEDQLHIQTTREYTKRLAKFGKKGPIQTFRVRGPMSQGCQQGTRALVGGEAEGSVPGRRMRTREEMEAGIARLMRRGRGEKEEEFATGEEADGEEKGPGRF